MGDYRKHQLNELSELRDQAYENSVIYKERLKKLHDSKIKNRIFNVDDQVFLFNSRLMIFSGKLKTRWSGPFTITRVFPYCTIELSQPDGPNFKDYPQRLKLSCVEIFVRIVLNFIKSAKKPGKFNTRMNTRIKAKSGSKILSNNLTMKLNLSKFQSLRIISAQRSKPNLPNANSKSPGTYCVNFPKFVRRTEVAKRDVPFQPKTGEGDDKPESYWTLNERRVVVQDQRLKSIIMSCLPSDKIESVISCETAKATWTDFVYSFEGLNLLKVFNTPTPAIRPCSMSLPMMGLRNSNHTQALDLENIYERFVYKDNLIRRRLNLDSKLPNLNTGRILVPESQVVNESLKLIKTSITLKSSKDSKEESLIPLPSLKNLQGASPSSEVMPLTFQPHTLKERPSLGIMKHTKPETHDSLNKCVSGTVTVSKTEPTTPSVPTEVKNIEQESKISELTKLFQMLIDEKEIENELLEEVEKLEWGFEQDIDDEVEEDEEDRGGGDKN
nr:reverse transcriptase domain-containing protein [Tanacetum cinerariifolium]